MRRWRLLSIVFIYLLIPQNIFAHTIGQHLEELYEKAYLPLFVLVRLLPFIGLGVLAGSHRLKNYPIKYSWLFLFSIVTGLIFGTFVDGGNIIPMINKVGIIFIGFLITLNKNVAAHGLISILILFGLTLGFEYGMYMAKTHEFREFYIILLMAGILLFAVMNLLYRFKYGKRKILQYGIGTLLITGGLIVLLLT